MTELEYFLTTHEEAARKLTAFDYATKLLMPALIGIATIIGSLKGMPRGVWWSLIGVIAFSLALGFSASLVSALRSTVNRIRDQRAAR